MRAASSSPITPPGAGDPTTTAKPPFHPSRAGGSRSESSPVAYAHVASSSPATQCSAGDPSATTFQLLAWDSNTVQSGLYIVLVSILRSSEVLADVEVDIFRPGVEYATRRKIHRGRGG
jgi:hypothetical protein